MLDVVSLNDTLASAVTALNVAALADVASLNDTLPFVVTSMLPSIVGNVFRLEGLQRYFLNVVSAPFMRKALNVTSTARSGNQLDSFLGG